MPIEPVEASFVSANSLQTFSLNYVDEESECRNSPQFAERPAILVDVANKDGVVVWIEWVVFATDQVKAKLIHIETIL